MIVPTQLWYKRGKVSEDGKSSAKRFDSAFCHNLKMKSLAPITIKGKDIRKLDETKIHAGISYKKLEFIEPKQNYIMERRTAILSRPIEDVVSLPNI